MTDDLTARFGPPGPDKPLAERVAELTERTERLTAAVENINPRVARAEQISRGAAAVVILSVVALLALAWVAVGQRATQQRLDALVQGSLCPLYALIVGGYNPESREAGEDRAKYEAAFAQMRVLHAALDCDVPLVPPRVGG